MSIRSALNRRRVLRDFSCLPVKTPARTRVTWFLRGVVERVSFKSIGLRARLCGFVAAVRQRQGACGTTIRAGVDVVRRISVPRSWPSLKGLATAIKSVDLRSILQTTGRRIGGGKRMSKRCIGIDIGRSHIYAVQMARTPDGVQVEKGIGIQTRRSTDSLTRVLRSLADEHGFDAHADIAVSLPHHTFFFADVETDPAGLERIRAGDTARLKDCFPIPAEDMIAQVCSVLPSAAGKSSLLVAAASCQAFQGQLNTLREAGIKPTRVDTPMTAAHAAIAATHPEAATGLAVLLYVDESTLSLAVMRNGGVLLVRSLPMFSDDNQDAPTLARQAGEVLAQEIEITWRRLFGKEPEAGLRIFLIASHRMAGLLAPALGKRIDSRVIPIDPYAGVTRSEAPEAELSLCVAEGLALQTLKSQAADQVDFLSAYRVRTLPPVRTKRELAVCGGLAAAVAAVWVVGLFLQLSSLESRYAGLKEQEIAVFRRVAPDEPTIVNPAAQLQQRIEALRKDAELFTCFNPGRPAPLEVLSTLSRQMPGRGLQLRDVLIAGDSVRITGSCDSFATFIDWQRVLEKTPGLRLTDTPQPKKDGKSERVEFQVSMSTTEKKPS